MSVKDEKIANLTETLSDIEESLHNCQQENIKLLEENKRLKQNAESNEKTIQQHLIEITTLETITETLENRINILEAPLCMQCGIQMTRSGSCYVCAEP